jgi:MFS transporter, DHA2 family, multidrug resistance protein
LGFVLYSSTVLLPQYAQELMGYTAQLAGMMISPGGIAIMVLMPLIGFLITHYDARKLIAFGFLIIGVATLNMMRFNLGVDFRTMMWARVFQASGIAFLFVPINTAAYAYLPREKSNAASGLINLSRNIGASVGISFVTTMLARRAQFHQSVMVAHLSDYNGHFMNTVQVLTRHFTALGANAVTASRQAYGVVGAMVTQQSTLLAYIDNFWLLGISALALVPVAFIMKKAKPGGPIAVH